MKPMIKYRGGKSKEIPFFKSFIPEQFDTYYEPFLGGGAVYFCIAPEKAVLNDINAGVMTFYREVKSRYPEMRRQLDLLQEEYEKNQMAYEALKKEHPDDRVENKKENL